MEAELAKLERDKEVVSQRLIQVEEEAQMTLRSEQKAHEEDVERLLQEKVSNLNRGPSSLWNYRPQQVVHL